MPYTRTGLIMGVLAVAGMVFPASFVYAAPGRMITFSGQTWEIKHGTHNPGNNQWTEDPRAVYVDKLGRLHLRVINNNGQWYSAEVMGKKSFGYGTYDITYVGPISNLDQNIVASPYIYLDDYHEIDIEFSKWKVNDGNNVYYTVQPPGEHSDGRAAVKLDSRPVTARIVWKPNEITLSVIQGGVVKNTWNYTGDHNFEAGWEKVYLNHWLIDGDAPTDGKEHEVVISSFRFTPLSKAELTRAFAAKTSVVPWLWEVLYGDRPMG